MFDVYFPIGLTVTSAMLLGGLILAAATVPALALRTLAEPQAATFLRAFWPRYYAIAVVGAALLTLVTGGLAPLTGLPTPFAALLCVLAAIMAMAFWGALQMIPAINSARDAGNQRFERLHRTAVLMTGLGLVIGLTYLGALSWVVPVRMLV